MSIVFRLIPGWNGSTKFSNSGEHMAKESRAITIEPSGSDDEDIESLEIPFRYAGEEIPPAPSLEKRGATSRDPFLENRETASSPPFSKGGPRGILAESLTLMERNLKPPLRARK